MPYCEVKFSLFSSSDRRWSLCHWRWSYSIMSNCFLTSFNGTFVSSSLSSNGINHDVLAVHTYKHIIWSWMKPFTDRHCIGINSSNIYTYTAAVQCHIGSKQSTTFMSSSASLAITPVLQTKNVLLCMSCLRIIFITWLKTIIISIFHTVTYDIKMVIF